MKSVTSETSVVSETDAAGHILGEEYVRWAYRLLLGREPENPAVLQRQPHNRELLLGTMLQSAEFRTKHARLLRMEKPYPYQSWTREAVALIHVPKTAGTSLHALLTPCFPKTRICPERFGRLHSYSPAELANYDYFCGHFDYFSIRFIPRQRVRCISIFRNPIDRLVSWYRFCRSYLPQAELAKFIPVILANELGPESFFEHPSIQSLTDTNNAYLFWFGSAAVDPFMLDALRATPEKDKSVQDTLELAVQRVIHLDGIALTERFSESVELIFSTLGLPPPQSIVFENVTDDLARSEGQSSAVPPVEMTPRLSRALEQLTRYDSLIYEAAKAEFERRLRRSVPPMPEATLEKFID